MKKLLHERLRECKRKTSYLDLSNGPGILISRQTAKELADEIERYYIPRPRFEDGEPIDLGMNVTGMKIRFDKEGNEIETESTGVVLEIHYDAWHGTFLEVELENGDVVLISGYEGSEIFKRPSPKVLDADGVEIKVGDTVWLMPNGNIAHTVIDVEENGYITTDKLKFVYPESFTHKEPDSLEKLRDEIREYRGDCSIDEVWDAKADEWIERFAALIERMG